MRQFPGVFAAALSPFRFSTTNYELLYHTLRPHRNHQRSQRRPDIRVGVEGEGSTNHSIGGQVLLLELSMSDCSANRRV